MKIGIMGTGIVAQTLGAKIMKKGHDVMFGTRDVARTLQRSEPDPMGNPPFAQWLQKHSRAKLESFRDAAGFGEVIINATAGVASLAALNQAGEENLKGKILMDVANPLDLSQGLPPTFTVCNSDSLGEQIQKAFPETKVVKTLNTVNCRLMVNPALIPGDHHIFVSGNDEEAKRQVSDYLSNWFGWKKKNIIDLGDITTSRGTEMALALWIRLVNVLQTPILNYHIVVGEKR